VKGALTKYGAKMISLLLGEAYKERINPWLNKNMHIADCIPIVFPRFHSMIANEVFMFGVALLIFVVMNLVISLLFSLPGLSNGKSFMENLISDFGSLKKFIVFSLLILAYLRICMFLVGRLNNETSIAFFGFLMMMLILQLAELAPTLGAWLDNRSTNFYPFSWLIFAIWCFPSYVCARKFVRQFEEAKSKIAARAR
jgi:hypothetical protein